jgi:hypothetical protein
VAASDRSKSDAGPGVGFVRLVSDVLDDATG